jgi:two-component system cell cycle response regulator DivK
MADANVLLVTPFDDERAIYGHCFRSEGYRVLIADGPEHALRLATEASPAVVVTRILQPGHSMNGIEMLRRLKRDPRTAHLPVIIITSLVQPELRVEAEAAGCDGYLLLPVVPDTLIGEVRRVLSSATRTVA